jgi:hypothetical protein
MRRNFDNAMLWLTCMPYVAVPIGMGIFYVADQLIYYNEPWHTVSGRGLGLTGSTGSSRTCPTEVDPVRGTTPLGFLVGLSAAPIC